jgi:hypothetical protein
MNDLTQYLEQIVDPTFKDFERNSGSVRHAYLTCVAAYHAVDRVAFPEAPEKFAEKWRRQSWEFRLVDIVAHHFKHVVARAEEVKPSEQCIPIGFMLGFNKTGGLETRNLYFVIRDAVKFLHQQAMLDGIGESLRG